MKALEESIGLAQFCTVAVQPVFRAILATGSSAYDLAIKYVQWKYSNIPLNNTTSIVYDATLSTEGLTALGSHTVKVGRLAFGSENMLISTLGHENVHAGASTLGSEQADELPAYQWEKNNELLTAIDQGEIDQVQAWIDWCNGKGPRPQ